MQSELIMSNQVIHSLIIFLLIQLHPKTYRHSYCALLHVGTTLILI